MKHKNFGAHRPVVPMQKQVSKVAQKRKAKDVGSEKDKQPKKLAKKKDVFEMGSDDSDDGGSFVVDTDDSSDSFLDDDDVGSSIGSFSSSEGESKERGVESKTKKSDKKATIYVPDTSLVSMDEFKIVGKDNLKVKPTQDKPNEKGALPIPLKESKQADMSKPKPEPMQDKPPQKVVSIADEDADKKKSDVVAVQDAPKSIATEKEDIISIKSTELASILTKVLHDNLGVLVQAAIKKLQTGGTPSGDQKLNANKSPAPVGAGKNAPHPAKDSSNNQKSKKKKAKKNKFAAVAASK